MHHFDPKLPVELRTDASGHGLGAVLLHTLPEGKKVIAYASRLLNKHQMNYSIGERVFGDRMGLREVPNLPTWNPLHSGHIPLGVNLAKSKKGIEWETDALGEPAATFRLHSGV